MHLRGNVIYNTWENFWKKAYKSSYFRAQYDETSERTDWSLSERQLFTQSNGRTLLGQDTMGRLHFLCTPHDKIYAVPSGGTDLGGQFKGYIGQYYQNDTALLLGKMKYDLELDNGLMISGANKQSWTTYFFCADSGERSSSGVINPSGSGTCRSILLYRSKKYFWMQN